MKHSKTSSLRERAFKEDQEKLDHVLSTILLARERDNTTRDIEAVARVENDALTVLIQRHVEGITVCFHSYVPCDMRPNMKSKNSRESRYLKHQKKKSSFTNGAD